MTRFFPAWCKGSIGDLHSPDAGSNPAAGSINPHNHARHTPRITTLTATLAVLALALLPTQAAFAEETLPDGRVFEKVTPVNNHGANVYVPEAIRTSPLGQGVETRFPFRVSPDGTAVAYQGDGTIGGENEGGKGLGNQYIARRTSTGQWKQSTIQPAALRRTYFQGFSSDLSVGVLTSGKAEEPEIPPLTPDAPGEGYAVLYARNFPPPAPVVKGKPKKVSRIAKCKRGRVRRGTRCVRKPKAKAKKSNLDRGTRR